MDSSERSCWHDASKLLYAGEEKVWYICLSNMHSATAANIIYRIASLDWRFRFLEGGMGSAGEGTVSQVYAALKLYLVSLQGKSKAGSGGKGTKGIY